MRRAVLALLVALSALAVAPRPDGASAGGGRPPRQLDTWFIGSGQAGIAPAAGADGRTGAFTLWSKLQLNVPFPFPTTTFSQFGATSFFIPDPVDPTRSIHISISSGHHDGASFTRAICQGDTTGTCPPRPRTCRPDVADCTEYPARAEPVPGQPNAVAFEVDLTLVDAQLDYLESGGPFQWRAQAGRLVEPESPFEFDDITRGGPNLDLERSTSLPGPMAPPDRSFADNSAGGNLLQEVLAGYTVPNLPGFVDPRPVNPFDPSLPGGVDFPQGRFHEYFTATFPGSMVDGHFGDGASFGCGPHEGYEVLCDSDGPSLVDVVDSGEADLLLVAGVSFTESWTTFPGSVVFDYMVRDIEGPFFRVGVDTGQLSDLASELLRVTRVAPDGPLDLSYRMVEGNDFTEAPTPARAAVSERAIVIVWPMSDALEEYAVRIVAAGSQGTPPFAADNTTAYVAPGLPAFVPLDGAPEMAPTGAPPPVTTSTDSTTTTSVAPAPSTAAAPTTAEATPTPTTAAPDDDGGGGAKAVAIVLAILAALGLAALLWWLMRRRAEEVGDEDPCADLLRRWLEAEDRCEAARKHAAGARDEHERRIDETLRILDQIDDLCREWPPACWKTDGTDSWVEDPVAPGSRITQRDLWLRQRAAADAWETYRAEPGPEAASALEEAWRQADTAEFRDETRRRDDAARARRLELDDQHRQADDAEAAAADEHDRASRAAREACEEAADARRRLDECRGAPVRAGGPDPEASTAPDPGEVTAAATGSTESDATAPVGGVDLAPPAGGCSEGARRRVEFDGPHPFQIPHRTKPATVRHGVIHGNRRDASLPGFRDASFVGADGTVADLSAVDLVEWLEAHAGAAAVLEGTGTGGQESIVTIQIDVPWETVTATCSRAEVCRAGAWRDTGERSCTTVAGAQGSTPFRVEIRALGVTVSSAIDEDELRRIVAGVLLRAQGFANALRSNGELFADYVRQCRGGGRG